MKQFYRVLTQIWKKKLKSLTKPTVRDKALQYSGVSKKSDPNFNICVKIKTEDHMPQPFPYAYMWTLSDHPGASWKCSLTRTPGSETEPPRYVEIQKKKNFFFFQNIIFAHIYGYNGHLLLEGN